MQNSLHLQRYTEDIERNPINGRFHIPLSLDDAEIRVEYRLTLSILRDWRNSGKDPSLNGRTLVLLIVDFGAVKVELARPILVDAHEVVARRIPRGKRTG